MPYLISLGRMESGGVKDLARRIQKVRQDGLSCCETGSAVDRFMVRNIFRMKKSELGKDCPRLGLSPSKSEELIW